MKAFTLNNKKLLLVVTFLCSIFYSFGQCDLIPVVWDGGAWDNVTGPVLTSEVIIDGDYDTATFGSFNACSLDVSAGTTLIIDNGTFVEVAYNVTGDGNIYLDTRGSFVQNDTTATFNLNGTATLFKLTASKNAWYYYTYWSSPVADETVDGAFPNTDPDRRFEFNANNYLDADGDDIDDNGDDWQIVLGPDPLIPGVGYAATSSRFGFYPGNDSADFIGNFNTGDVLAPISFNATNLYSWNLIGNPYPSALNFNSFYSTNSAVIDGAAYFWSQSLPPDSANSGNENFNFNQNDYAIYTVGSGGTASANGSIPDEFIDSAQGFFIVGMANGNVTFTNSMRSTGNNNEFYRIPNKHKKNRLWVNLTTDNGVFNQILLAYVQGATNEFDGLSYDAPRNLSAEKAAIVYSLIEEDLRKYAIQGRSIESLNNDESIQIGFTSTIPDETQFKFSIADLEGEYLSKSSVYLYDWYLDIAHNLSQSDYEFSSGSGEFNNRFEISFNKISEPLDISRPDDLVIKYNQNNSLDISTTHKSIITSIQVYDMLGRLLLNEDIKVETKFLNLDSKSFNKSIYIIKATIQSEKVITKKVLY